MASVEQSTSPSPRRTVSVVGGAKSKPSGRNNIYFTKYTDFDVSQIHFKEPTATKRGISVYMNTSSRDRSNPTFEINEDLQAPFGVSFTDYSGNVVVGRNLNLELNIESEELQTWLHKFDQQIIKKAAENSELWFKKKMTEEQIADTWFRHSLTHDRNVPPRYPPKLRLKVGPEGLGRETKVFIHNGGQEAVKGSLKDITRGSTVQAIVEASSLWFMSRQFGCSLFAKTLLVWPARDEENHVAFSSVGSLRVVNAVDNDRAEPTETHTDELP